MEEFAVGDIPGADGLDLPVPWAQFFAGKPEFGECPFFDGIALDGVDEEGHDAEVPDCSDHGLRAFDAEDSSFFSVIFVNHFWRVAMHSISTRAPLGMDLTATAERAG